MKKLITLSLTLLAATAFLAVAQAAHTFPDIQNHKYKEAIEFIAEKGIVSGYPDGNYKPNNLVNRAEIMKIVIEGNYEETLEPQDCFPDVKKENWFSKYVCKGKDEGIIEGYPDGNYRPGNTLNFVEALKILQLAYEIPYNETSTPWYKNSVQNASELDIIPLDITDFDQTFNRGQMAEMLARLIHSMEGKMEDFLISAGTNNCRVTYQSIQKGEMIEDTCQTGDNITTGDNIIKNTTPNQTQVKKIPTADELEAGMIKSKYTCGICNPDEKCVNGKCTTITLKNKNAQGNYTCEAGESFNGNATTPDWGKVDYLDCEAPCQSENCNEYASIECACDEYDVLSKRHGCVANAGKACSDCAGQENLFPEALKIQTEVIQCLSDYFEYKPNRLIYKVFYDEKTEKCTLKEGCTGREGGVGGADYVMFNSLDGSMEYNEKIPTKPEHITADLHETTHYFVYQMLHGVPSWFHEAIAIQTNERLDCTDRQIPGGDAYLHEREQDNYGINMDDGTYLNSDFHNRLTKGQTTLSEKEYNTPHIIGTLFIMGLKENYKCGAQCVKDAVIKLREKEQEFCRSGDGSNCAVVSSGGKWSISGLGTGGRNNWEKETTSIIKETFDEVINKDTAPLFDFLKIEY